MATGIISRVAGTSNDLGDRILTVGPGGQFTTLDDALNYIEDVNPSPIEFGDHYGGTATTVQYDDNVAFASQSTTFNGLSETDPITFPAWIEFDSDGDYYLIQKLVSATELKMYAGYKSAGAAGKSYKLYRMPKYTIMVLPGTYFMASNHDLRTLTVSISIIGCGVGVSEIYTISSIQPPNYGAFVLSQVSIGASSLTITLNGAVDTDDSNFGRYLVMNNITLQKDDVIGGTDVVNLGAAAAFINDVSVFGKGDLFIVYADGLYVNNVHAESEALGNNGFSFRCWNWQCTKDWQINNITGVSGSGAVQGIRLDKDTSDTSVTKVAYIKNCRATDNISVRQEAGVIGNFVVYSLDNVLDSFIVDRATIESTRDNKPDGSALTAATTSNGGVVN